MTAVLKVQNGTRSGDTVELNRLGSYTVGRRSSNDVNIVEKAISRHHCRVDYDGEFYWLVDCDSHNGTFVNGKRVSKCMLYDGDVIEIGHVRLVFSQPEDEDADYADE